MQTGFAAVEAAIKEAAARSSASSGAYLKNLFWKDGDRKIVRFLTDEIVTCRVYEYVNSKDGNGRDFINAASLGEGRTDWVKQFGGQATPYGSRTLAPAEDRKMTFGIAALREEVQGSPGQVTYQDVLEEVIVEDDKGNKETYGGRYFAVIKAAHGNFWDPLVGYFQRYGTVCDRDYEITRRGGEKGTTYTIIPCTAGPDPELPNQEAVQKAYGYGTKRAQDQKDPQRFLYVPQTLTEWVEDNASEGRARHWLLGETSTPAPTTNGASSAPTTTSATSSGAPTSSGTDEFHPSTTQNPNPAAHPTPAPATDTKFAGLREAIRANK
jgi:hypothetical protein